MGICGCAYGKGSALGAAFLRRNFWRELLRKRRIDEPAYGLGACVKPLLVPERVDPREQFRIENQIDYRFCGLTSSIRRGMVSEAVALFVHRDNSRAPDVLTRSESRAAARVRAIVGGIAKAFSRGIADLEAQSGVYAEIDADGRGQPLRAQTWRKVSAILP